MLSTPRPVARGFGNVPALYVGRQHDEYVNQPVTTSHLLRPSLLGAPLEQGLHVPGNLDRNEFLVHEPLQRVTGHVVAHGMANEAHRLPQGFETNQQIAKGVRRRPRLVLVRKITEHISVRWP